MKIKIGILVADTPLPEIVEKEGDYCKLFNELLNSAAASLGQYIDEVETNSYDCIALNYPKPEEIETYDAFLITGSKYSAYETDYWILQLKQFILNIHERVKFIGVCFGHQIICEALGGKVMKNPKGWEVGWTEITFTNDGKKCLNTDKQLMKQYQMHQDEVVTLPPEFINLASTNVSEYQSCLSPGKILTIQSHPEFSPFIVKKLVDARVDSGIFTKELRDRINLVNNNETDGLWFAIKILEFVQGKVM